MNINMNFLTHRFRMKLLRNQLMKIAGFFLGIAAIVIGIAYVALDMTIKTYDGKIATKVKAIKETEEKIAKVKQDTENLNVQGFKDVLKIAEDLFTKKELRFSSLLYNVKENMPDKVWLKSLKYKDEMITIDGMAADAKDRNAELVVLGMERKLVDSKTESGQSIFKNVKTEFIKDSEELGNDINTFKYTLQINYEEHTAAPSTPGAIDVQGGVN